VNEREISDLARLMPAPDARDLPSGRQQILKEHLMAEFRQATAPALAPRRQRGGLRAGRRGPAAAIATGASVLVAAGVAAALVLVPGSSASGGPGSGGPGSGAKGGSGQQAGGGSGQLPGGGPVGGAQAGGGSSSPGVTLLAKIANVVQKQPQPAQPVGDNEFMYIRSQVQWTVDTIAGGHETSTMEKPHERQVWLPVANICVPGLLIEDGSRTVLGGNPTSQASGTSSSSSAPTGGQPQFIGCGKGPVGGDPTYRLLQSLPTDPHALLSLIYAQTKDQQVKGTAPSPDAEAFTIIGDLMREAIVPPKTAAALYRAAALIPGVTVVGHATDGAGRAGVAIAWTVGHYRGEWIFDPKTGQFLGELDYNMATGKVTGEDTVLQRAFTAKAGQLP
jgi:hypothetical protein